MKDENQHRCTFGKLVIYSYKFAVGNIHPAFYMFLFLTIMLLNEVQRL